MSKVYRVYVEKRKDYAVESDEILNNLRTQLKLDTLTSLSVVNRYDVQGVSLDVLNQGIPTILSEPMVDDVYKEEYPVSVGAKVFAIEYLPGQYDQRADACEQCFQLLTGEKNVKVKCAKLIVLIGELTDEDVKRVQDYLINPVDQRLASLEKADDLADGDVHIDAVPVIHGFIHFSDEELRTYIQENGMAMNYDDLKVTQDYYKNEEKRDPSETELKVLDTYWSDHCRHTTFATIISQLDIESGAFKEILEKDVEDYKTSRHLVYGIDTKRPLTLMDLATISMKELRKTGYLDDLEVSEEINACSVELTVHTSDGDENWLLMFKNETHNHPTEIEPFGGAATCLGGAIRDPLSGRAYVYQSMRITGAGDPRTSLDDTLPGKLPQRKICQEAAHGFSSYGNQIGLTTGFVHEVYDEGFVAKRMELGAVVAAAPKDQVKRLEPLKDHIVLLIGGRTGRDGIGGATGSSKKHELKTTTTAGAEVQKGNPVEERKIQRLFRNKAVSEKIVRCNDFGAGGVCVAVGELAPGLDINLDAVLKKYEGLTGTELAISESQERMAIVIDQKDEEMIKQACQSENLEVVRVAVVTDNNRLTMRYMGQTIVDIDRAFLDKNGASRFQDVKVELPDFENTPFDNQTQTSFVETSKEVLSRLSVCGQKGLIERFDSSIGNGTVLSPFGGKTLRTETEGMAALIPVLGKETTTCSLMSYGYNPLISKWSPYHGAMYAIVESIAKIVAMGGDYHTIRFSFQEYFEKLLDNPSKWGKPFAALLGAYRVQSEMKLASIGGKDSMSGTFEDLDVPPTLVSFAITGADVQDVMTPELKGATHTLVEVMLPKDQFHVYDFDALKTQYDAVMKLMKDGQVYSAYTIKDGGVLEAVYKMAFGNAIGVELADIELAKLTAKNYGNIILEVENDSIVNLEHTRIIGHTNDTHVISYQGESLSLDDAYAIYEGVLDDVYPTKEKAPTTDMIVKDCEERTPLHASKIYDEVKVVIPVFPGTNCEYDSARAFEKAGATVQLVLIRNKTEEDIKKSVDELEAAIRSAQIVMLPGGFSAGDEPEGSGKFIATVLRNPKLKDAITDLLDNREGLMIGICNGFQALVKLGLLPYGHIKTMDKEDPTLTFNTIGRHLSQMVDTRICSVKSPWLANVQVGDIHTVPISHGEGRFVAPQAVIEELFNNGQVFTQYVDSEGKPTMESPYNPNGSLCAIEGILSADGRILGKMAHSERQGENRNKNIYGEMDQQLFEAGVKYFKGGK
ncbi:phosphoribosylformylglycinamidine synthase [Candidatus Stoquefichus sp. SB1]|uniref:phosphoribosylformylglycinamidine synthase n=1 Tax=Candidatus Stoquefichus sp. SB1 TaxID=1658109 RepID=UPI00067F0657|nr:phosphoribosylformylglycinamidine synthase [Candidatus Stoquefichus sp. SB1]